MTRGDFTAALSRFVLTHSERFASAKAIGKFRKAKKKNVGHIAALKIACRNGGVDLELNDWCVLCCILERNATPALCTDIYNAEKFRRAGETLRTTGGKVRWVAVINGVRIPTSLAVIQHFQRAYGKNAFPIEFEPVDEETPPEPKV